MKIQGLILLEFAQPMCLFTKERPSNKRRGFPFLYVIHAMDSARYQRCGCVVGQKGIKVNLCVIIVRINPITEFESKIHKDIYTGPDSPNYCPRLQGISGSLYLREEE